MNVRRVRHRRVIVPHILSWQQAARTFSRALLRACVLVAIVLATACGGTAEAPATSRVPAAAKSGGPGFRTRAQAAQHYQKHGAEFGRVSEGEYVRLAQSLRDAPLRGEVEEVRRPDGTVSRYDRGSGAFVAYDADGTIRTFFKPNTGESYFRRQAQRSH